MQLYACKKHCEKYPTSQGCNGNKSAAEVTFDEDLAKANCATKPNAPGCPMYCKDHHMYPGCPMFCQVNVWHPACGHVPAYCHTNPNGYGCPKAVEEKGLEDVTDEVEAKSICSRHKMRPGCPLFCQMNPLHKSCGHVPLYCKTNPNGYNCPKAAKSAESHDKKNVIGYPKPPHPQWCGHHHGMPSCR